MKCDVLTIGAAVRDIFVRSTHFERIRDAHAPEGWDSCFPMGAKIDVEELNIETGGGATNAAVTFANWGFQTACVSRIGKDPAGADILRDLQDRHIRVSAIQQDTKFPTAHSIILLSGAGSRSVLVHRGAAEHLDVSKIQEKSFQAKWIYLTSISGDLTSLESIFQAARKINARIAWNPGSRELHHGLKHLAGFLARTAVLIVNRDEGALLANCSPKHLGKIVNAIGDFPRIATAITDGPSGAYIYARGGLWHTNAQRGKIVNTTGAGDAFGSGFVASLLRSEDLTIALKCGTANAFGVVTHMGAKAGILKKPPGRLALANIPVRCITEL